MLEVEYVNGVRAWLSKVGRGFARLQRLYPVVGVPVLLVDSVDL